MSDDYVAERIKKMKKLEEEGINPYPQLVVNKTSAEKVLEKYQKLKVEQSSKKTEKVAGRLMNLRVLGKIAFAKLQDETGRIQLVFQASNLEDYKLLKLLDLGDIIFAKGNPYRTKRGELSINVKSFKLAAKALRSLPEKYHGLKDEETKFRKRYLDAIMNPGVLEMFEKKALIIKSIRGFLDKNGFLEVFTPILQSMYGGASAEPFITHHNALNTDFYLRIATEMYLKRLIVAGYEKIYELGVRFRNEGIDKSHLQEMLDLEFYWVYQDYQGLMKFTEKLFTHVIKKVNNNSLKVKYQGRTYDFTPPYKRITFRELIRKDTGIDINEFDTFEKLKKEIEKKNLPGVDVSNCKHYGALLDEFYKRTSRPKIIQPTFMTHYPTQMIPLAKKNEKDPSKINTFQLIFNGWEIVKAYDELNDPLDQRERLKEQQKFLKLGDKEAHPLDEDFLEAMEHGMPPTAGFGLGVERLCQFLMNQENIRSSVFFPLMRTEK